MSLRIFNSFLPHAYPRARRKYIVENGPGKCGQTFQSMYVPETYTMPKKIILQFILGQALFSPRLSGLFILHITCL